MVATVMIQFKSLTRDWDVLPHPMILSIFGDSKPGRTCLLLAVFMQPDGCPLLERQNWCRQVVYNTNTIVVCKQLPSNDKIILRY